MFIRSRKKYQLKIFYFDYDQMNGDLEAQHPRIRKHHQSVPNISLITEQSQAEIELIATNKRRSQTGKKVKRRRSKRIELHLTPEQVKADKLKAHVEHCKNKFITKKEDTETSSNIQEFIPFTITGYKLAKQYNGLKHRFFESVVLDPIYEMQEDKEKWSMDNLKEHVVMKTAKLFSKHFGIRQLIECILIFAICIYVFVEDVIIIIEQKDKRLEQKDFLIACMVFDIMTWMTVMIMKSLLNLICYNYSVEIIGFMGLVCAVFNLFFGMIAQNLVRRKDDLDNDLLGSIIFIQTIVETCILIYFQWSSVVLTKDIKKLKLLLEGVVLK